MDAACWVEGQVGGAQGHGGGCQYSARGVRRRDVRVDVGVRGQGQEVRRAALVEAVPATRDETAVRTTPTRGVAPPRRAVAGPRGRRTVAATADALMGRRAGEGHGGDRSTPGRGGARSGRERDGRRTVAVTEVGEFGQNIPGSVGSRDGGWDDGSRGSQGVRGATVVPRMELGHGRSVRWRSETEDGDCGVGGLSRGVCFGRGRTGQTGRGEQERTAGSGGRVGTEGPPSGTGD